MQDLKRMLQMYLLTYKSVPIDSRLLHCYRFHKWI